jgi:hypothetical protein
VREKRFPATWSQDEFFDLVITPLLPVAADTCHYHVSWHMESDPEAVHPLQMLYGGTVVF